jgi:transposase-like protein
MFMPQLQLPIFPTDSILINSTLAFKNDLGKVTYFYGNLPVFSHDENDIKAFRMITSQFYVNGSATQSEIAKAFGVTLMSVKRSVKLYRTQGINGFYAPRKTRGPVVLTDVVLEKIQQSLNEEKSVNDIAVEFGLKKNTIDKAIRASRLQRPIKKKT